MDHDVELAKVRSELEAACREHGRRRLATLEAKLTFNAACDAEDESYRAVLKLEDQLVLLEVGEEKA